FRFIDFEAAAGIDDEVDFARAIAPEEQAAASSGAALAMAQLSKNESFPNGSGRRRRPQFSLGTDIQERAEKSRITYVKFRTLNNGLRAVRKPGFEKMHLARCFEH